MMNPILELFQREGSPLPGGGNQPFALNDPDQVWLLAEGKIDVFFIPTIGSNQTGPRFHFLRLEGDNLVLGMGTLNGHFLAVPVGEASLYIMPRRLLWDLAASRQRWAELSFKLNRWIDQMYRAVAGSYRPPHLETLHRDQQFQSDDPVAVRAANEALWVSQSSGKSLFEGFPELARDATHPPFPLSSHTWLELHEQAQVKTQRTVEIIVQPEPAFAALEEFHRFINGWVSLRQAEAQSDEARRLQGKFASQKQAVHGALQHLSSLLAKRRAQAASTAEGDDLFKACSVIGRALGIAIKEHPASKKRARQKDPLGNLAKASRVRVRKVVLSDRWWIQDNGPILGYLRETNQPVALIPTSASSYDLVNPVAGTREPVDPSIAEQLNPVAYTFYRPFSDKALSVWEVFKFGLHNARSDLLMIVLMGMAGGVLGLLAPIVTGIIFDQAIPSAARGQLLYLTIALFVAAISGVIFQITRGIALLRLEAKSEASIQGAVWDRLLSLPLPFFRNYTSGDLAVRSGGINEIRGVISEAVLTSVLSGVFSVFNFALLFYYSAKLAVVATLLIVIHVAVTVFVSFYSLRFTRPMLELQGKISGQVLQFITGISKLRVAGAEPHAYSVWARAFSEQKKIDFRAGSFFNGLSVFSETYPILTTMSLFLALAFWTSQSISTGQFLAFSAAFSAFLFAMLSMSAAFVSILHAIPVYERSKAILQTLPEVNEAKADPGELTGRIELNHISFRYKADGPLIIKDLSIAINPGEFVAIVGPSGSGKSTLIRLLLGFETPESGAIYLDGMDLAGLDIQAVRRQFGVVLQNGKLMPGDIFQNIVGSAQLTIEDAWEAAERAGFAEDIHQMPMGMHTVLSEGAGTLSGGQRQRLMIARAIVSKPRILLFDEATSALDNRTQAIVSRSLEHLQSTRVVIAHRLSTIMNAHRIFVMQNGRVLQSGKYHELIHQPGPFAELAARQIA